MRTMIWKHLLILAVGMVYPIFFAPQLEAQSRDTPTIVHFYQKSGESDGTRGTEYWVEYKPCAGSDHCFVRVTSPNERTLERIKRKAREDGPNTNFQQWKITDGITLDEIGDVDGMVVNVLPNPFHRDCPDGDVIRACDSGEVPDYSDPCHCVIPKNQDDPDCPAGQHLQNHVCVANCEPGYVSVQGECQPSSSSPTGAIKIPGKK